MQPEIAKWTRACSYDREGTGFSDAGPMPRTSVRIAKELRTALHRAGISGPYILVGSAFGGDNVRTFADLYMMKLRGWFWMTLIPSTSSRRRCEKSRIEGKVGSPRTCATVAT